MGLGPGRRRCLTRLTPNAAADPDVTVALPGPLAAALAFMRRRYDAYGSNE